MKNQYFGDVKTGDSGSTPDDVAGSVAPCLSIHTRDMSETHTRYVSLDNVIVRIHTLPV